MKRFITLFLCGFLLVSCGSKNETDWYTAGGDDCGKGLPRPGCDYYYNGNKILLFSDPYYTPEQVKGKDTWVSPDGITYGVACGCALT